MSMLHLRSFAKIKVLSFKHQIRIALKKMEQLGEITKANSIEFAVH